MSFHNVLGRIGPLANIDILLTLMFCLIIIYFKKLTFGKGLLLTILIFCFGESMHWIFDVETPVTRYLSSF